MLERVEASTAGRVAIFLVFLPLVVAISAIISACLAAWETGCTWWTRYVVKREFSLREL
ncbi:MAG: hypothetical protein AB1609_18940 [Bacillota bacterium]